MNKLPLSREPELWTLENFGPALAPHRMSDPQAFVSHFEERGYVLRDACQVAEFKCDIAFHPANHLGQHVGMCFDQCA